MEATSETTKCVVCGRGDRAMLLIPSRGSVCLSCIKKLNTTVDELVDASQKREHRYKSEGASEVRIDLAVPSDNLPSSASAFSANDAFQQIFPSGYSPMASAGHKSPRRRPTPILQMVLGGLAGLLVGAMILRFGFGVNIWKADLPKQNPAPAVQKASLRDS